MSGSKKAGAVGRSGLRHQQLGNTDASSTNGGAPMVAGSSSSDNTSTTTPPESTTTTRTATLTEEYRIRAFNQPQIRDKEAVGAAACWLEAVSRQGWPQGQISYFRSWSFPLYLKITRAKISLKCIPQGQQLVRI
jgi:hypothetical protein